MLPRQPLRFLLADDPGAGRTIMVGLLINLETTVSRPHSHSFFSNGWLGGEPMPARIRLR